MEQNNEKEKYWREHHAAARSFAGSEVLYCKQQGITYTTFRYWKQRLSKQGQTIARSKSSSSQELPPRFVEAIVSEKKVAMQLPEPKWVADFLRELFAGTAS